MRLSGGAPGHGANTGLSSQKSLGIIIVAYERYHNHLDVNITPVQSWTAAATAAVAETGSSLYPTSSAAHRRGALAAKADRELAPPLATILSAQAALVRMCLNSLFLDASSSPQKRHVCVGFDVL
eukprot:SAG31_NODE_1591_length_7814_cov_4.501453_6_plen_125_part_00